MRATTALLGLLLFAGHARADDDDTPCKPRAGTFKVSLKPSVKLSELVTWASSFSCRRIVYGAKIADSTPAIELVLPKELDSKMAWRLFESTLRAMNLTLVKRRNMWEVTVPKDAKQRGLPLRSLTGVGGDRLSRALIHLEHIGVKEAQGALKALGSKDGEIVALGEARTLVVTDYGENLRAMQSLLRTVDQLEVTGELALIRVHHADTSELLSVIQGVLGEKAGGVVFADPRSGSLLVRGTDKVRQRVRAIVERLDVPLTQGAEAQVFYVRLSHAKAKETAEVLSQLMSRGGVPTARAGAKPARRGKKRAPTPTRKASTDSGFAITADEATNAVLIRATPREFLTLKDLIAELDAPRKQVLVEAVILEVSNSSTRDIGGSAFGLGEKGWLANLGHKDISAMALAGGAAAGKKEAALAAVGGPGLTTSVLGPSVRLPAPLGITIPSFGVLFRAAATAGNVRMVSSPKITTADNQLAEIQIADTIPVPGQIVPQLPGVNSTQQNIDYKDVGLTLKVTPHLGSGEEIQLDIDLTFENVGEGTAFGVPTTLRRSVKNTVRVMDQESIVIGGLVSEEDKESVSKVPLLGDIPLLGHLFKSRHNERVKKNLLILLTPSILGDQADRLRMTRRKLREHEEVLAALEALPTRRYVPDVDYGKKRGLLESIRREVATTAEERKILESFDAEPATQGPKEGLIDDAPKARKRKQRAKKRKARRKKKRRRAKRRRGKKRSKKGV